MILPIPATFGPFQSSDINSSRQGEAVEDFAGNGGPSLKRNSRPWHFFEVQAVVAPLLHCVTLLDANASLLTTSSADGFAPIHLAAHFGHVAAVRLLVERDLVELSSTDVIRGSPIPVSPCKVSAQMCICCPCRMHCSQALARHELIYARQS
jgi:ankyrin repeat protein